MEEWGIHLHFLCVHVPSRNGIIERYHRTIKWITVWKQCSIQKAVYWHNATPKDNMLSPTAPANANHTNEVRLKSIEVVPALTSWTAHKTYKVGDELTTGKVSGMWLLWFSDKLDIPSRIHTLLCLNRFLVRARQSSSVGNSISYLWPVWRSPSKFNDFIIWSFVNLTTLFFLSTTKAIFFQWSSIKTN